MSLMQLRSFVFSKNLQNNARKRINRQCTVAGRRDNGALPAV
jgi:hypothetical protein